MILSIIVPHFPALGSGGVLPVPPTILMSGCLYAIKSLLQGISPPPFFQVPVELHKTHRGVQKFEMKSYNRSGMKMK
jgi:hypothetical protein